MATTLEFARSELDAIPQLELAGDAGQRRLAHQGGACPGQGALVGLGPAGVQRFGNDQVHQGVAKELQAFVVRRPGAAVPEGLLQQFGVAKGVVQPISHPRPDR